MLLVFILKATSNLGLKKKRGGRLVGAGQIVGGIPEGIQGRAELSPLSLRKGRDQGGFKD